MTGTDSGDVTVSGMEPREVARAVAARQVAGFSNRDPLTESFGRVAARHAGKPAATLDEARASFEKAISAVSAFSAGAAVDRDSDLITAGTSQWTLSVMGDEVMVSLFFDARPVPAFGFEIDELRPANPFWVVEVPGGSVREAIGNAAEFVAAQTTGEQE